MITISNSISIDNLANTIAKELMNYSQEVAETTKKAVDKVVKEVNTEVKSHIEFNQPTGAYVKAFAIKTTLDTRCAKKKVWHVKSPQHALTHLLEDGHALKNGGRSKKFPHIKYGEELAIKNLPKYIKESIE